MPIHSHLSQKDPQRVIKEVKKAIEDGEGCQVVKSSVVYLFGSFLVVRLVIISSFFVCIVLGLCRFLVCSMWSVLREIFISLCMA